MNKRFALAGIAATLIGSALAGAPAAQAASRDGACDAGEFCYYYNSGNSGSVSDFTTSIPDYGTDQPDCYEFKGAGAGKGLCVKNEAASVWNRASVPVTVYYNTNYGTADVAAATFASGFKGNLPDRLHNENASHRFGSSASIQDISAGLYKSTAAYVSCGFDSYVHHEGRHEGIDIKYKLGSAVHALVKGEVIYIDRGANGGGNANLSTISVYNAAENVTIVYLHSAPLASLTVGQNVGVGTQIATEAYRGITNSGDSHTHVEERPGRKTLAAVSSDNTLVNPDPAAYWRAHGYDSSN